MSMGSGTPGFPHGGLLAEALDATARMQLGDLPQAVSNLALNGARTISRARTGRLRSDAGENVTVGRYSYQPSLEVRSVTNWRGSWPNQISPSSALRRTKVRR